MFSAMTVVRLPFSVILWYFSAASRSLSAASGGIRRTGHGGVLGKALRCFTLLLLCVSLGVRTSIFGSFPGIGDIREFNLCISQWAVCSMCSSWIIEVPPHRRDECWKYDLHSGTFFCETELSGAPSFVSDVQTCCM
jgi:hypothetical protein